MKSSSIASTDILRVLCDMVDLLHSRLTAEQGYSTLELKVAYHRALTGASGPVRAEGRVIAF
jgi:acyl-coenzyme A thioesterase PaaI-like protein